MFHIRAQALLEREGARASAAVHLGVERGRRPGHAHARAARGILEQSFFYENGPGFAGDDITYKMANILLDDMFAQLDAERDGTSTLAADLRFTHAEEIFPLAALLQLPGSTRQLPVGTEFTYAGDPFRGAQVSPMGANIQWDLFRRGDTYLVRMLYNEQQTAFKAGCTPIHRGSNFYELDEFERCYGYTPAA